jgi:hypothetical protein
MSQRERRNRKDEAASAVARFGELEALVRECAQLRVLAPQLLADPDPVWRNRVARSLGTVADDPGLPVLLAEYEAQLSERIAVYADDEPVRALAEAALTLGWPG